MSKRINQRLVKLHRNYTIGEASDLLGVHRNTMRKWINIDGLEAIKEGGPLLIIGSSLRVFLVAREAARKRPGKPGEIYCFGCKQNQRPASDLIEYQPHSKTSGMITALCPVCSNLLKQFVGLARLKGFEALFGSIPGNGKRNV